MSSRVATELYNGPAVAHMQMGSLGRLLPAGLAVVHPIASTVFCAATPTLSARLRERLADGRKVVGLVLVEQRCALRNVIEERAAARFRKRSAAAELPLRRPAIRRHQRRTRSRRSSDFGVTVERLPDVDNMNDIDGLASLISCLRRRRDDQQHDGASRRRARQGNLSARSIRAWADVVLVPRPRRQSVLSTHAAETKTAGTAMGRARRRNRGGDRVVMLATQRAHTGSISESK